jgi:hypothetical protein
LISPPAILMYANGAKPPAQDIAITVTSAPPNIVVQ